MVGGIKEYFAQHLFCIILVIILTKQVNGRGRSNANHRQIVREPAKSRTITINDQAYTFTYSNKSFRNYNSGARYYMRNKIGTSTLETFGYSFYSTGSYYYSGYGYRMHYPPSEYFPVYMGYLFYYFPPMFYRFYRSNSRYWDDNRPRYVCRNLNAFWPLENQTSEFVDGRLPALDLRQFDEYLPDPPDEDVFYVVPPNFYDYSDENYTELNSLSMNKELLIEYEDFDREDMSDWSPLSVDLTTVKPSANEAKTRKQSPYSPASRKILAYEYFACPDGKDPDEIECCGPADAQYCCVRVVPAEEWLYILVGSIACCVLIIIAIRATVQKCRQNKINFNRSLEVRTQPQQQFTTTAVHYVPANESGVRIYVPSNPITTTAYQYQEVQAVSTPMIRA